MKIVRVDNDQIDVIDESEKYIDIYSFSNYSSDNYGKTEGQYAWRINGLTRVDRLTGIEYNLHAAPVTSFFDGHDFYQLLFKINDVDYTRSMCLGRDEFPHLKEYILTDCCYQHTRGILSKELKNEFKDMKSDLYIGRTDDGDITIDWIGNKYSLSKYLYSYLYEHNRESDEKKSILDDLELNEYDMTDTNSIIKDFYRFSKKYYLFGDDVSEPELQEVVGENNAEYEVNWDDNIIVRKRCIKHNNYKQVDNIQKWRI